MIFLVMFIICHMYKSNLFSYFSSKKKTPISEDVSHFVVGVSVFSYTELEDATRNFNPSQEQRIGGFGVVYYV
ncbi:hypothetical protein Lser_V15G11767 [Lactuca serriola]